MAYVLALASAALYGSGDFLGGLAAKRTTTLAVVAVSQGAGLILLGLILLATETAAARGWVPVTTVSASDYLWGAVAGGCGGVGVSLLYRALAIGTMGVVAPTTAVCAVIVPVAVSLARGIRPAPLAAVGIALALVGIALVSRPAHSDGRGAGMDDDARASTRGLGLALTSGVSIGFFFLSLASTSEAAGLWPLLSARAVSVCAFAGMTLATGHSLRMRRSVARLAVGGGSLDMAANALYLLASHQGPLPSIVTLASLYPASTVLLARTVLGERLSATQGAGIVCALSAVVLIVSARP
ncbi:MAG: EamA/RhaT family transporter [Acidimicrobiia bacterium]|nr:EamA/RhaT family transporter [Acidimicrobiia bacterium]